MAGERGGGREGGSEEGNRRSDDYTAVKVHVKGRSKEERAMFCQTFTATHRPNQLFPL